MNTEQNNKNLKQITLPLSFENDWYIIRLEPTAQYTDRTEFIVSMKCKEPLSISFDALKSIPKLSKFIEIEAQWLLSMCLRRGNVKQLYKKEDQKNETGN